MITTDAIKPLSKKFDYRCIRKTITILEKKETYIEICKVYYDVNDKIVEIIEHIPVGNSEQELLSIIDLMMDAFSKPTIDIETMAEL